MALPSAVRTCEDLEYVTTANVSRISIAVRGPGVHIVWPTEESVAAIMQPIANRRQMDYLVELTKPRL